MFASCLHLCLSISSQFTVLPLKIAKISLKNFTYFWGLRSFKVIYVDTTKKHITSASRLCLCASVFALDKWIAQKSPLFREYPSLTPTWCTVHTQASLNVGVRMWTAIIYIKCWKFYMLVVLVYLQPFWRGSLLKYESQFEIAKNSLKPLILGVQGHLRSSVLTFLRSLSLVLW